MKKLLSIASLAVALAASTLANATTYNFSWTADYGYNAGSNLVTGSFDGTANGNLITNLSNISVFINGVAFSGNGNLYGSSYSPNSWYGWVSGGAQASFDGSQNNFLFINADYPNSYNYTNFFYSVFNGQSSYAYDYDYTSWNYQYVGGSATPNNWHVTSNAPEPSSIVLFGLGLLALARFRKSAM